MIILWLSILQVQVIEVNGVKHSSVPYELEWHVNTAFIVFKYEYISAECDYTFKSTPLTFRLEEVRSWV